MMAKQKGIDTTLVVNEKVGRIFRLAGFEHLVAMRQA
jgi:hypothetical protein